jgi:hypothetical protein
MTVPKAIRPGGDSDAIKPVSSMGVKYDIASTMRALIRDITSKHATARTMSVFLI